ALRNDSGIKADYADTPCAKAESIGPHSNASRARKYDQKSHYLSRQRKSSGEFAYFFTDAIQRRFLGAILQRFRDQVGNLEHFFFFHAARGDCGRAHADASGFERRAGVERNRILVYGNSRAIENFLRFFSVEVLRAKIDKHQVIIGAAGDDAVTVLGDAGGERFRVHHDLALIIAELRLQRFVETNRFGGDHVHQRTALDTGKHSGI